MNSLKLLKAFIFISHDGAEVVLIFGLNFFRKH